VDLQPGPLSMSVLLMVDRTRLSPTDAITFLQVHERLTSWWASLQVDAVVAAASPEPLVEEFTILEPRADREVERTIRIQDSVREEFSSALRLAPVTAQARIDSARLLAGPLTATGRALELGEISTGHAAVIVDTARRLPGYLVAESAVGGMPDDDPDAARREREEFRVACVRLQERVLPVARRGTLSSTRQAANRAVLAIDAQGQRRRRERARCTRDVFVVDEIDGISTLIARLATEQAHAIMTAVDAAAHLAKAASGVVTLRRSADTHDPHCEPSTESSCAPSSVRSLDATARLSMGEYRAQALADLIVAATSSDRSRTGLSARLDVIIPLDVLTGASSAPVEIANGGLLGSEALRDLLADPGVGVTMRRLVADPMTGTLLDVGRRSYAVPDRLREFIVARDRTCRFPGCRRRAARCQLDHATAWDDGGETSIANLGALCQRHHQLKTHGGWDLTDSAGDGSCTWISPQGRRYRHEAQPALVHVATVADPDPPPF